VESKDESVHEERSLLWSERDSRTKEESGNEGGRRSEE